MKLKPSIIHLIVSLLITTSIPLSLCAQAVLSFTSQDQGHTDDISRMIGWQFTVASDPLEVVSLGWHDFGKNGLLESHKIGIWERDTQTLITSATVPSGTAGVLDGFFRYVTLDVSVWLTPGVSYVISGFDTGADAHVWDIDVGGKYYRMDVSGFSVDPVISIVQPGGGHAPAMGGFAFPTSLSMTDGRSAMMGPNFQYAAIPEPAVNALLVSIAGLGLYLARSRKKREVLLSRTSH